MLLKLDSCKICDDADFCKRLSDWADIIRKTFYDGGIEEIISTAVRSIVKAYSIFNDKEKQSVSVLIVLMMILSKHSLNCMIKLMLTLI